MTGIHAGVGPRHHRISAVSYPEFPVLDVPLISEDLLLQARRLDQGGAPALVIEEILDRVAALREGRG